MFGRRSMPILALGLACACAARCGSGSPESSAGSATPSAAAASAAPATPPSTQAAAPSSVEGSSDDLPPLPMTPFPSARPPDVVRAVYTFAARHPEILSHVPCFCGCERQGHANNDDCFVTSRDARGRVTGWEPHGVG